MARPDRSRSLGGALCTCPTDHTFNHRSKQPIDRSVRMEGAGWRSIEGACCLHLIRSSTNPQVLIKDTSHKIIYIQRGCGATTSNTRRGRIGRGGGVDEEGGPYRRRCCCCLCWCSLRRREPSQPPQPRPRRAAAAAAAVRRRTPGRRRTRWGTRTTGTRGWRCGARASRSTPAPCGPSTRRCTTPGRRPSRSRPPSWSASGARSLVRCVFVCPDKEYVHA